MVRKKTKFQNFFQKKIKKKFLIFEDDLRKYFSQFGNLLSAYIVRNSCNNRSKGFGFIEYDNVETAKVVLNKKNHIMKEKWVNVCPYHNKSHEKKIQPQPSKFKKKLLLSQIQTNMSSNSPPQTTPLHSLNKPEKKANWGIPKTKNFEKNRIFIHSLNQKNFRINYAKSKGSALYCPELALRKLAQKKNEMKEFEIWRKMKLSSDCFYPN